MNLAKLVSTLFLLTLLATASEALATVFCVGTSVELADALDEAATNGLDDEIRIRTGVVSPTEFLYDPAAGVADDLTISGGWAPGCQRSTARADLTVLHGLYSDGPLLTIYSSGGQITIRNLSIAGAQSETPSVGALHIGHASGNGPAIRIERVIFRQNETYSSLFVRTEEEIDLIGSLFAHNVVAVQGGASAHLVQEGSVAETHIVANTFSSNEATLPGSLGGLRFRNLNGLPPCHALNNILWDNDLADVEVIGEIDDFSFNDVGVVQGSTVGTNNLQVDPRFFDPLELDYRLRPDSPLLDNGSNFSSQNPSHDLLGVERPQNLVYDRGAYELPLVFADGFESGDASAWSATVP